jgi:hypothetical protein
MDACNWEHWAAQLAILILWQIVGIAQATRWLPSAIFVPLLANKVNSIWFKYAGFRYAADAIMCVIADEHINQSLRLSCIGWFKPHDIVLTFGGYWQQADAANS